MSDVAARNSTGIRHTVDRILWGSHMKKLALLLFSVAALSGCATYTTPGAGASLAGINNYAIETAFSREPAAQFPASVVSVRVQGPGYYSNSNRSYGRGNFSVVTTRDIETDEDFASLAASTGVARLAPMTRILLPEDLSSTTALRTGAAQLKADLLLMYTIDTSFGTEVGRIGPLQTVALGFFPNRKSFVDATTSVMLLDVRSGYVYGTVEATETETQRSSFWGTDAAIDRARRVAERASFEKALEQTKGLFDSVYQEYGKAG